MLTKAPKGTRDILPYESYKWQYIEKIIKDTCESFGYSEIRTPVFEHTELFERGVGDTTDVVQKEMYTFVDKGARSITLKPEGTASAARSYIENSLYARPQPVKMYYNTSCYRYERPQQGRLREFHQFGVEVFGSDKPSSDAEVISLAVSVYERLGVKDLKLNINSIGCPICRADYNLKLKEYFGENLAVLCATCNQRFDKNPMRIIDCKSEGCKEIAKIAPVMLDSLCEECSEHFVSVKKYLQAMNIQYNINPYIVRGLDYYTKTVFEFISENIGAKGTVCGGGRYDGLINELGGPKTPAVGFGLGIERLFLLLDSLGIEIENPQPLKIYIANIGNVSAIKAQQIVYELRKNGISADNDHMGKTLKAQMKYADKLHACYTMVLGENEMMSGTAELKNMLNGDIKTINLDNITQELKTEGI